MIWDWEAWWALELEWRPSRDLDYLERVRAWYEAAWRAGLTVDFVHPERDLARYPLAVVPSLYLTTPAAAENLTRYVADGGTLLVSYFSGTVDAHDAVHPGGYPGALREVLGVTVEEWRPLLEGSGSGSPGKKGARRSRTAGPRPCGWPEPSRSSGTRTARRPGARPSPATSSEPARRGPCPRAPTP